MIILRKLHFTKKLNTESFPKLILILIFIFSIAIMLKTSAVNNIEQKNQINKQKESIQKIELIDKLNAYIDEQSYLLSSIELLINEKNSKAGTILDEILANLIDIEEEAIEKKVKELIDLNEIDNMIKKISCFKKILKK
jgi:hypothetical protein